MTQILDPRTCSYWDELLLRTSGGSFFHSSAWARVIAESYGYTPLYFAFPENDRFKVLIPMMEVDSFLTGRRGVSLPFTDYCDPLLDGDVSFQELFSQMVEYGRKRKWKYIELRGGDKCFSNLAPRTLNLEPVPKIPRTSNLYLSHTLDLTKGEETIFSSLRDSTRRNIKRSLSRGVKVTISNDPVAIKEFYRLNCITRRRHGLPPHPYHFFQKIYQHIISKGLGFVSLASLKNQTIAGSVFFHFGDKGIYKYGASDMKFQELRANNLAIWEAIRWFCNHGFKSFCFGRTEPENKGLQQFKTGWGTDERTLCYYRFDMKSMEFITNQAKGNSFTNKLFNGMPIPVLKLAGSFLYRHMG